MSRCSAVLAEPAAKSTTFKPQNSGRAFARQKEHHMSNVFDEEMNAAKRADTALGKLSIRMPPEFVKRFKQAALDRDLKLNDLFELCFNDFMKK
jgi:hypothetical protein